MTTFDEIMVLPSLSLPQNLRGSPPAYELVCFQDSCHQQFDLRSGKQNILIDLSSYEKSELEILR